MPSMSCFNWFASALRPVSRIFRIFFHERHPTAIDHYPPTPEQLHSQKQAFIDSIDHDAVCRLASRYNNEESCHIFDSKHGSFNACFFVEFPSSGTRWVVRIPIDPVVNEIWTKLQSEVATMRYVKNKTKIPLPDIHAYGRNEKLVHDSSTTQAFLILDFVSGQPLDLQALRDDTLSRRKHFYAQLIEVMTQLRTLEFTKSGSLMPGHEAVPVVDNVLSIPLNEFQVDSNQARSLPMAHSAREFALNQLNLMEEEYRLPRSELSRETVEMEIFALNHLKQLTQGLADDPNCFVLSHSDLRPTNIIVDDDLNITSILDWEWTHTVPRQFFMPPSWITLHNLVKSAELGHSESFLEFREVLEEMASSSSLYRPLADEWEPDLLKKLLLPLAEILLDHSKLLRIYYKFIFPQYFKKPRREVVAEFLQSGKNYALEVHKRVTDSEQYTNHLKDSGLYVLDDEARQEQEYMEKIRQLDRELGIP
ncbi:hypothetical protein FOPG_16490 [Fusarium oxysporum f. sp. conglutinans race 2 54008]|uniref:Aminoglycoside phosphotransferase domain-containing protein n=2 Tax=Fusarium oxysporum f. sp. conglutinans TaxID=100902 RepID=A0A8H6LBH1_FUSOX|nr:hypothetical protein FOPG_16490 [Fusarium oxysporum f. sp. conglutinans race 2 54008]KAF6513065.1 hypothetical protein HZS61_007323 [Fusarium oxysporum f. sp. conglutinans]